MPFNAPALPQCITYNKDAIGELLNNALCVGLRVYPAINADNRFTLVLVGVDENGENILTNESQNPGSRLLAEQSSVNRVFVDEGQTCPPYPAPLQAV